jgi:hypothetical protein
MSTPGAPASSRRPDGRSELIIRRPDRRSESIIRREAGHGDEDSDRRSACTSAVAIPIRKNNGMNENNRRPDIHWPRYLTQQARMEVSYLEDLETPASSCGLNAIDARRKQDIYII